jgi:hypothetical protein
MRPIVRDRGGTRFKDNAIVQELLARCQKHGFGLNQLAGGDFSQSDWEQFYQLIGYSLTGYHELSMVSDASTLAATEAARSVDPGASGCRDHGCKIHCGVAVEEGS